MPKQEYFSPIGRMLIVSDGKGVSQLCFYDKKTNPAPDDITRLAAKWLDIYFLGKEPDFKVPLSFNSTPFRNTVWSLLAEIPYGQTVTYGELAKLAAKKLGKEKMSPQAIGGAVGHNNILIFLPCHRVLAAGGYLGGFSCGTEYKKALLEIEKIPYKTR